MSAGASTVRGSLGRAVRDARWLRRDRAILWCCGLFAFQAAVLAVVVLKAHGALGGAFGEARAPFVADFQSFYAAGRLALSGAPQLAYDHAAHWQAQQAVAGPDAPYNYFFYPPPFLLICAAFAWLPYMAAFALFEAATLALYMLTVRRIAGVGSGWHIAALAFPAVFWTLGLGQNAFLTAALFGAGTLLIDAKPMRAGALLGMLCYKPHFGLLVPVALAAGGRWRAFAAAAATVAAVCGVTAVLFGAETWGAYLRAFAGSGDVYKSGEILLAGYVTPFGAARLAGLPAEGASVLQAAATLASAALVALLWRRQASLPVRSTALIAATLLSVPLALVYDLLLVSVCVAWLVRAGSRFGFLPWERALLASTYVLALCAFFVGTVCHVPLAPLAPAIILLLCWRRAVLERALASRKTAQRAASVTSGIEPPPATSLRRSSVLGSALRP